MAKQLWFYTGSQDLYGPETLQQVNEQSKVVVQQLVAGLEAPVELVFKGVIKNPDAIRRAMKDATASDECVGVITWMHTFSPAKMWIAGLEALGKPLLHLHTQAGQSLPWSTIDMDFMNLNQAAHGDLHGDVVAEQVGEAGRRRRAARPAQQPDQAGAGAGVRGIAVFLRQPRGQARRPDRVIGRQAHAQVADHGQHLHGIFHADGFVELHGHNVTANMRVNKEHA